MRIWQRKQPGQDKECIDYWIGEFNKGRQTDIYVDRKSFEVADGNHRLVAAIISGKRLIGVIWTPLDNPPFAMASSHQESV